MKMGELRTELRQDMAGLRHSFELRLAPKRSAHYVGGVAPSPAPGAR